MKTTFTLIISLMLLGCYSSIAQPGSLDTSFDPGTGADDRISGTYIQSDGKIIIRGDFTSFNGIPRNRIARVNVDGSLDTSFDPGTGVASDEELYGIYTASIQSDGKIIIGGRFTSYNGTAINRIARLNADGSLDTSFDPGTGVASDGQFYSISTTSIQSDGKIIIGGSFSSYDGTVRNGIARLNVDGSLDTSFDPGTGVASDGQFYSIYTTSIQSDGKIVIGGFFSTYNGITRNNIARLNADGSLDTTFDPGTGVPVLISGITTHDDGKIIIWGWFDSYNGTLINQIARLNADGSLDTSFDPPGTEAIPDIFTASLQGDGKIIIGGVFTYVQGVNLNGIARLNVDGSLDTSFDPGGGVDNWEFPGSIQTTSIQSDGKIIIGGSFILYDGTERNRIARINSIVTGIDQLEQQNINVKIFPNPFNTTTTLQTEFELRDAALTIFNSSGQAVKHVTNISGHTVILNRDNLPSGLYFMRLTQDNQIITTDKLIITD